MSDKVLVVLFFAIPMALAYLFNTDIYGGALIAMFIVAILIFVGICRESNKKKQE